MRCIKLTRLVNHSKQVRGNHKKLLGILGKVLPTGLHEPLTACVFASSYSLVKSIAFSY